MPQAMAVVWDLLKDRQVSPGPKLDLVSDFDRVLGLKLAVSPSGSAVPDQVRNLVQQRQEARAGRNWAESDRLRNEITKLGFVVEDGPGGQALRPKKFGE
jgi:cysteinyl-tRNA synthetase